MGAEKHKQELFREATMLQVIQYGPNHHQQGVTGGNKLLKVKERALEKKLKELDCFFLIWEDLQHTKKIPDT